MNSRQQFARTPSYHIRGAAARARRSLIASPRPSCGIGMTAMRSRRSRRARADARTDWRRLRRDRRAATDCGRGSRRATAGPEREQGFARIHAGALRAAAARAARSARPACRERLAASSSPGSAAAGSLSASGGPSACSMSATRQAAGAQQGGGPPRQATMVDSKPERAWPAIENEIDAARRGRPAHAARWSARRARAVGGGRNDGLAGAQAGRGRQDGAGHAPRWCRARRLPVPPPGSGRLRQHQGQRARPERGQSFRGVVNDRSCGPPPIVHMRDQRIEGRPALGGVEPRDRFAIGRIGAKAVDRLGRKRHQSAGAQDLRSLLDDGGVGRPHTRCKAYIHQFKHKAYNVVAAHPCPNVCPRTRSFRQRRARRPERASPRRP